MKLIFEHTLVNEDYFKGVIGTPGHIRSIAYKVHSILKKVLFEMFFVEMWEDLTDPFVLSFFANPEDKEIRVCIEMRDEHYHSLFGKYVEDQRLQLMIETILRLNYEFKRTNWVWVGLGMEIGEGR